MTPLACKQIVRAAVSDRKLSLLQRTILLCLFAHTDDEGLCWPSKKALACSVGSTPYRVRLALRALVRSGWIDRKERRREHAPSETNLYRVDMGRGLKRSSLGGSTGVHGRDPGNQKPFLKTETIRLPGGSGGGGGGSCPNELSAWAVRQFQSPLVQTKSALSRLARESGATSEELRKFLLHQRRHRDLGGARAPIALACSSQEFRSWQAARARMHAIGGEGAPKGAPSLRKALGDPGGEPEGKTLSYSDWLRGGGSKPASRGTRPAR